MPLREPWFPRAETVRVALHPTGGGTRHEPSHDRCPRRCRVQGRPSQQQVRRRRLRRHLGRRRRRRLPNAMAAGGLGRRCFAPTALASVRWHARVALVRCYASRRGAESWQAAFACHGRLPEQSRLWLCWKWMVQPNEVLRGVCETVGWLHRKVELQRCIRLRLLVHRCAHRFASPLAAAAVAAAIAADVAFRPLPFQHRLWMCRPK